MSTNHPSDRNKAAERQWSLSRRHFLRGLGACVALPALPSLITRSAFAADISPAIAAGAAAFAAPRRMVGC